MAKSNKRRLTTFEVRASLQPYVKPLFKKLEISQTHFLNDCLKKEMQNQGLLK